MKQITKKPTGNNRGTSIMVSD